MIQLRDLFRPPARILRAAGVREGLTVLDFGCGPGGFSLAAAEIVGREGKVYALDVQPLALKCVVRSAARKGLGRVEVMHGDRMADVPAGSIDMALLYDVLHIDPDPEWVRGTLAALHRVLKAEGVLSVRDHHLSEVALLSVVASNGLFRHTGSSRWSFQFSKA